jgi:aspartyl/asparaginyl beta-hydroxylase (cupin superfamily)
MGEVMEPREPGYSIFKGTKPEPKIVYELPDGTTTIWLSEYIEAMVQAEQDRIVKLLEVWWETDQELEELIALIKGENK